MNTSKQFFMFGEPAELVIRVKHENGTVIEVPVSDVADYVNYNAYSELRIPLRGEWFDKLIVTHDFSSLRRG